MSKAREKFFEAIDFLADRMYMTIAENIVTYVTEIESKVEQLEAENLKKDSIILDLQILKSEKFAMIKKIKELENLTICSGCGHLSWDKINPPHKACCPDSGCSSDIPVRDFIFNIWRRRG